MRNENAKSALSEYFSDVFTDEHPSMVLGDGAAQRLTLILADGTSYSLPYVSLNRIRFEPGTSLRLEFTSAGTFEIRGINLDRLFDSLTGHQVRSIIEVLNVPDSVQEHAVTVLSIEGT